VPKRQPVLAINSRLRAMLSCFVAFSSDEFYGLASVTSCQDGHTSFDAYDWPSKRATRWCQNSSLIELPSVSLARFPPLEPDAPVG
jgi:hypothetical protein